VNATNLHTRIEAIRKALEVARASLAEGESVDLAGIEEAVRAVCADIAGSAVADRPAIEPAIRDLIADFDALADALGEQHRRNIAGNGLDTAARAAYGVDRDPNGGSGEGA
jgi:hypothetical protein